MDNRFENFTFLIMQTSKLIQRIKNRQMKGFNLKAVHVMCLFYLSGTTTGLTHGDLVRLTLEDKAAISRALETLKERNMVVGDQKRQGNLFTLTPEGEEVAKYIKNAANDLLLCGGNGVSEEEREVFYRVLTQITSNLSNYYAQEVEEEE